MDKQTKQIVYLMLGCLCVWVVLSEFIGNKYISTAIATLFPFLLNAESGSGGKAFETDYKNFDGSGNGGGSR